MNSCAICTQGFYRFDRLLCGDFGRWIYGGKFLASEDYGDKISFKSSFQIFKIKYFLFDLFLITTSIKIQYKNSGKKNI